MVDTPNTLSRFATFRHDLRRTSFGNALAEPATLIGVCIVLTHLLTALFGPLFSPHSVSALVGAPLQKPSLEFWLGTDHLGRDYLTRLMAGGRVALTVSLCGVSISLIVGTLLGLFAGYRGGRMLGIRACFVFDCEVIHLDVGLRAHNLSQFR